MSLLHWPLGNSNVNTCLNKWQVIVFLMKTVSVYIQIQACMAADMLQQSGATPLPYESVNMSKSGNSDNMLGMPGQVCGIFCCSFPQTPTTTFFFTWNMHTLTSRKGRFPRLIAVWIWVVAVSKSCVFSLPCYIYQNWRVTYVPLRVTRESYTMIQSLAEGLHTLAPEQSKEWPGSGLCPEGSQQQVGRLQARFTHRCHSHSVRVVGTNCVLSSKKYLHHQAEDHSTFSH